MCYHCATGTVFINNTFYSKISKISGSAMYMVIFLVGGLSRTVSSTLQMLLEITFLLGHMIIMNCDVV